MEGFIFVVHRYLIFAAIPGVVFVHAMDRVAMPETGARPGFSPTLGKGPRSWNE
jgi:hypothetical protein